MNASWIRSAAIAVPVAAVAALGWTAAAQAAPTPTPTPVATATATADAALVRNLTFMRQEEQLARDVYTALAAKYDQAPPFVAIARSEQRHFDTIGLLLQRYGIADPAAGRAAGSYADAELQALYTSLMATGSQSLAKAYEVGVTIETTDAADLKKAIAETTAADAKAAFTNLLNGTQHHLAAFTAAADGKVVGARNGEGMRNGRRGGDPGQSAGTGRGPGQSAGTGRGPGRGQGQGRGGNVDRPADCPLR